MYNGAGKKENEIEIEKGEVKDGKDQVEFEILGEKEK